MATMQSTAVVGVFHNRTDADRAVDELIRDGYKRDQIGVVAREVKGVVIERVDDDEDDGEGVAVGAIAGASVAGLVSLGISYGVIPVIGPVLAVGPLAAALISAASGAVAAGLIGALMDAGLSEEEAAFYESEVREGRYVVTVYDAEDPAKAWDVLHRVGAYNFSSRNG